MLWSGEAHRSGVSLHDGGVNILDSFDPRSGAASAKADFGLS